MKGDKITLAGDTWVVVDVAPAPELADMVAVLLEEEGYITTVKGPDFVADVFSALGSQFPGVTLVLVPETQAEAALALIAESVRDYEGDELKELLSTMTAEEQQAFLETEGLPPDIIQDES
jgi:hypothetical protein